MYKTYTCNHQQSQEIEHYQIREGSLHAATCAPPLSLCIYICICVYISIPIF